MKNISDSNLMNQISRDGKTSIEALNAMLKSSDNINGVTLNDFLGSMGAKDRAIAEANLIRGLMDKNSLNGVVDFKALNQSLASLNFESEFAKELTSQILSKQSILNNTSDILNSLGDRVIKPKTMSQGQTQDPLKRGETMRANFIVEKLKPLIPYLGNNEALKLHLNRAILNANGDFKLAIKNIDDIPSGNLPTPTRNLLNEFKNALKDIEQVVKSQANEPTKIKSERVKDTLETKALNNLQSVTTGKKIQRKEMRGVYNVLKNGKQSTRLYKDITADLNAVDNIVKFEKGKKDYRTKTGYKNGYGLEHIKKHLGADKNGYVTEQELLHIGDFMRSGKMSYLKEYKNGKERIKRVYESFDNEGTRFRVLVGENEKGDTTISFFSNRKGRIGFTHNAENYTNNLNDKNNSTLKEMKSQDLSVEQKAKQYAKFLSEANEPTQVAPDELYKAYKAKKDLNKPKSK